MSAPDPNPEDVALSLTLAVVAASPSPLLLLDGDMAVLAASTSFCKTFAVDPADLTGQSLYTLSQGTWDLPDLRLLLETTLSGQARDDCEIDLRLDRLPPKYLVVQARRLQYLDLGETRLLLALSDVTEARDDAARKEGEARQNLVLLQEVRHRVANSLQIIASVLLQNARKTPSDETRGHLTDAHHRVMSVAALERLLSTSEEGDVDVHAYFTALCESITASMIGEADNVILTVDGGEGAIDARVSVSLGLIITELVINALKYAFPDGRPGKITVDYNFDGPNWILCVRDNGIGMPATPQGRIGLGTSIILALAGQLRASVTAFAECPGTKVSIEHFRTALAPESSAPIAKAVSGAPAQPGPSSRQAKADRS